MARVKKENLKPGDRGAGEPHPVDVHVGQRLKLRRTLMGMTQGALGASVGLTFQQIQKYERGANRISASKMWLLANVLDETVQYFYDEMPSDLLAEFPGTSETSNEEDQELTLHRRQTLELVRAFSDLEDQELRKNITMLVRTMTDTGDKAVAAE